MICRSPNKMYRRAGRECCSLDSATSSTWVPVSAMHQQLSVPRIVAVNIGAAEVYIAVCIAAAGDIVAVAVPTAAESGA